MTFDVQDATRLDVIVGGDGIRPPMPPPPPLPGEPPPMLDEMGNVMLANMRLPRSSRPVPVLNGFRLSANMLFWLLLSMFDMFTEPCAFFNFDLRFNFDSYFDF